MELHEEPTTIFDNNESYPSYKSESKDENLKISKKSELSDASYFDPPSNQHLRIDFTPDEQIDNDYVQNKCCQFWDFIHSLPEIQHLIVMPEINYTTPMPLTTGDLSKTSMIDLEENSVKVESKERTALSMLEFAKQKGIIDRTFDIKIPRSQCTLGSREYTDFQNGTQRKKKTDPCYSCLHKTRTSKSSFVCPCDDVKSTSLKALVDDMQDWDAKHTKSMEPPSHPASLQHCILQEKLISDLYI